MFNNTQEIQVKLLKPNAKAPVQAHEDDACFDMVATRKNENVKYIEYGTDIAFNIPKGYVGLIFPRSSVTKEDMMLKNSVGVIDAGYQGEIRFRFIKSVNDVFRAEVRTGSLIGGRVEHIINVHSPERHLDIYKVGDKIGQIMFIKLPKIKLKLVDEFTSSIRGEGGFGSTGK